MTEVFGPYRVVAEVATGSLGRVYRAHHIELGRDAAVKELSPAVRGVAGQAERLRAEAATLAALAHPNIVALYDYVEEPGRTWLAEQWVDGATLAEILRQHGRLTAEQALGVVVGAITGLAHAHERDIVHRDISCSNILADLAGTSMLVDFGVAAPSTTGSASAPDATVIGGLGSSSVVGTPAYLSPEAARGEPLGKASDVYSTAAVLFHLLTGAPPFSGAAAHVVRQHRDAPAPRLMEHGPELEALVARSLSKVPTERPGDAAALLAELEQAASRPQTAYYSEVSSSLQRVYHPPSSVGPGTGAEAAELIQAVLRKERLL